MINFKYTVDPDKGSAKFEKDKKQLVIDLPITGVTKVTHESMRKEKEQFEKNMKRISGGLVHDISDYTVQSSTFETEVDLQNKEFEQEQPDLDKLKQDALNEQQKDADEGKEFLKVYDESKVEKEADSEDTTVLNEIKYKQEDNIELPETVIDPMNNKQTLVQEIGSQEHVEKLPEVKAELGIPPKPQEKEYKEITANFQQQKELLFFMFNIPDYKEENIKYFVSESHLYIEHDSEESITKCYIKFPHLIDPYETSVKFIVNYVNIIARKEKNISWKNPGSYLTGLDPFKAEDHDLQKYFRSNFIKKPIKEKKVEDKENHQNDNENDKDVEATSDKNETDAKESEMDKIHNMLEKSKTRQVSHLDLNCPIILDIF